MTDPRIHARRVTVARQQGRRRRRRLLAGLLAAAAAGGGLALVHTSLFGARTVRVYGAPGISRSAVIAAAGLRGAPPLVDLSTAAIASGVERLPWVLTAAVRLEWPAAVSIRVTERIPVAAVPLGTATAPHGARTAPAYAVCDVAGRVLEIVRMLPPSLPLVVLAGPPSAAPGRPGSFLPSGERAELEVAAAMPESMVPSTAAIGTSSLGTVVGLRDHLEVIVGNGASLPEKFVSLATVLARTDLAGVGAIDLRDPEAPVLLPKGSGPMVPGIVGG